MLKSLAESKMRQEEDTRQEGVKGRRQENVTGRRKGDETGRRHETGRCERQNRKV